MTTFLLLLSSNIGKVAELWTLCTKTKYHYVYWLHTLYVFGHFQKLLFSNFPKMAHFQLNWTCSERAFPMCPTLPNKIPQDLSSKIPPPPNKFLDIGAVRGGARGQIVFSGKKSHFFKKFILSKNVQWLKIHVFSASKIILCCPIQI